MIRKSLIFLLIVLPFTAMAETLQECQKLAEENYPLVKRYEIIKQTEQLSLSNIATKWLPQLSAYAQGTYQSEVPELPDVLKGMLAEHGQDVKGVNQFQYRFGLDLQQNIYDGGTISRKMNEARAQSEYDQAQNAADIYEVLERVNGIYFGMLLVDERLKLNDELCTVYESNVEKLQNMLANGVAMGSDLDAMKAELASIKQQKTDMLETRVAMQSVLSLLCGKVIEKVEKPSAEWAESLENVGSGTSYDMHPKIQMFNSQLNLLEARDRSVKASVVPQLGVFAQGFYGYMGYDMFRDMMHNSARFNGMVGARLSWNLSSFYTRKNERDIIKAQKNNVEADRSTFLLNQSISDTQQQQSAAKYRKIMEQDNEIIELRQNVRAAAEAELSNGVIDTNNLILEISREHQAQINRTVHEIEYLKSIYEIKRIQGIK